METDVARAPVADPRCAISRARFLWVWIILATLVQTPFTSAQTIALDAVRVGFDRHFKVGFWNPIEVRLTNRTTTRFEGYLLFVTPDPEDTDTVIPSPSFAIEPGRSRAVSHFVRPGRPDGNIQIRVIEAESHREVARGAVDFYDPQAAVGLEPSARLILAVGTPGGLVETGRLANITCAVAAVREPTSLPTQWFAYQSVDTVVLATSRSAGFLALEPAQASALATWVRQGGDLVVTGARNHQRIAASFLADLLPARLVDGAPVDVRQLPVHERLESFVSAKSRMPLGPESTLTLARLEDVTGSILLEQDEQPLVIAGRYGLGRVRFIALDTDETPFVNWPDAPAFWLRLFQLPRNEALDSDEEGDSNPSMANVPLAYRSTEDVSVGLAQHLEHISGIQVVPFSVVALLILGYILLIGPVDYFFLKKVVGRLELTWITFPTIVIVVSVLAAVAADWMKGRELRAKRIDIVDVDASSGTLRGTSVMSLFSPSSEAYDLGIQPGLAARGPWSALKMGSDQATTNAAWFSVPDNVFRGSMRMGGGVGLLGRGSYQFSTDADQLLGVPIRVRSLRMFQFVWLAAAAPTIESGLSRFGTSLVGSITNRLDQPLEDVILIHGGRAFQYSSRVEPNATVQIEEMTRTSLVELERTEVARQPAMRLLLTSRDRVPVEEGKMEIVNDYFRSLAMVDRTAESDALLIARVPDAAGARLLVTSPRSGPGRMEIDDSQADERIETVTYLRVLLSLKKDELARVDTPD